MEIIANSVQTVQQNQNILFSDTVIDGSCSISHRTMSGLAMLKGVTNQCRARFKVFFSGNIAIPTSGTVAPISVAIAIDGEPIVATKMIATPVTGENYFNVSSMTFIDVPAGCCTPVSVQNTSTQSILVENANFIIERVA